MLIFLPVNRVSDENTNPEGGIVVDILSLNEGAIMPVFTSAETLRDFVEAYFPPSGDVDKPGLIERSVFELTEIIAPAKEEGLEYFVVDPVAVSVDEWKSPLEPRPVANICGFVEATRPIIEKMRTTLGKRYKENSTKVGDHPVAFQKDYSAYESYESFTSLLKWLDPRAKYLADNAQDWKEWLVEEDPLRSQVQVRRISKVGRNNPCSCGSGKKYKKCHGKPL